MAYELDIVTPAQTGPNTPFIVTSSGDYPGYEAWRAFDHDNTLSGWQSFYTLPVWIKIYIFGNTHVLTSYAITAGGSNWSPKDYTLEGSNDNVSWTVLDTQTGQGALPRYEIPIIGSTTAYTYYKLNVTALTGSGVNLVLSELELIDNVIHGNISGSLPVLRKEYLGNTNTFLTFPALAIDSFVAGVPIVSIKGNLPVMSGILNDGVNVSGDLTTFATINFHATKRSFAAVTADVPMPAINIKTGARVAINAPGLNCFLVVSQTIPASIVAIFPKASVSIKTGAKIRNIAWPVLSGTLTATTGGVVSINNAMLPRFEGSVNGLTQQFAQMYWNINPVMGEILAQSSISVFCDRTLPMMTASVYGYSGQISEISTDFPVMMGYSHGYQNRGAGISGNLSMLKRLI